MTVPTLETEISATKDRAATAGVAAPRRSLSRVVALDIVAFLDITAIMSGALLPALIYNTYAHIELDWTSLMKTAVVAGFIAYLLFRNAGFYDTTRTHDLPQAPARMLLFAMLAVGSVIGLGLPMEKLQAHAFILYALWISCSFTLLLATRGISHAVLARLTAAGRFERRVAVFGAGPIARRVRDELAAADNGIRFAGVFDDRKDEERLDTGNLEVAGRLSDLLARAETEAIDDIIIALPQSADNRIAGIIKTLEQAPASIHIVTHIASDLVGGLQTHRVSAIGPVGLLDVKDKPLADWAPMVKRAEDVIIAGLSLLLLWPVLVAAMIAIKIESKGPVFYRQRRRGLNRRIFDVLKLRTLTVSETDGEIRQVTTNDDRVTRVGRILRRTSIDELPQLWNVLKGEMSIVGPRPHALVHDEQFSTMLEEYANRHQVKPGMTGLAQVEGFRGQTKTIEQIKGRVDRDMLYVRSWSLWLDLNIIARTFKILISGKNAD